MNRNRFLKISGLAAGRLIFDPVSAFSRSAATCKLTILHTNDVHSHLEPFGDDGGKYANQGGVSARAALINKIRSETEQVLLLDSGDIFQGTPYFNLYKGEPEMKAMTLMGYDAATMGNHDFDAGVEGFAKQLQHADFPILTANYEFANTPLENKTKPYQIFQKGKLKVGVFGLGIQLAGLVPKDAYGTTQYLEPIQMGNIISERLKMKENCDLVICLSHLGHHYDYRKVSDLILAKESTCIDIILGGHTHTFLDQPVEVKNKRGNRTIINQVGWAGLRLGRLDMEFTSEKKSFSTKSQSVIIEKETRAN